MIKLYPVNPVHNKLKNTRSGNYQVYGSISKTMNKCGGVWMYLESQTKIFKYIKGYND